MAKIIRIPSVEVIDTKVVGVSKANADGTSRQEIIRREVIEGDSIQFEPEPDNPHDADAVKVLTSNRSQIGYLNKEVAPKVKTAIENEAEIFAKTSWVSGEKYVGVGLRIELVS